MSRVLTITAALSAALAVMTGAFGAHALRGRISPEMLAVFETANRYHMFHALAMLAAAWAADRWNPRTAAVSGWLFLAGSVLFSGSLYTLSVGGERWWGAVTPFGGVAFIAGWLCLAWAAYRGTRNPQPPG